MKQQHLFHSFWLASTAAVLASKPAWADTVQVSAVQIKPTVSGLEVILETPKSTSTQVFTSSDGKTFVADIANTQMHTSHSRTFRAENPTAGITTVTVTPVNDNQLRVRVTGKAGVPVGKVIQSDRGLVFSLTTSDTSLSSAQSSSSKSDQLLAILTKYRQAPPSPARSPRTANPDTDKQNLAQVQSPAATTPSTTGTGTSRRPAPSPRTANPDTDKQNLAQVQSPAGTTPSTTGTGISRRPAPSPRATNPDTDKQNLAQVQSPAATTPSATGTGTSRRPAPSPRTANPDKDKQNLAQVQSPAPTTSQDTPSDFNIPSPTQGAPAPGYLDPNPNPLQFPTKPEEVRIRGSQPLTIQQVIELARRNSPTIRVAQLTVERSRAALREQLAAEFPTLALNSGINREQSAQSQLSSEQAARQLANQTPQQQQQTSGVSTDPTTAFTTTLTLSYNLFTSGARRGRIRAAEEQLRFDELDLERQFEQLRLDVATAYYNSQGSDEQVRINQSAVTNAQASLRDTIALESAGVGTRFDVLQSQVQLANSVQDLTNSLSQQRIDRRQLVALLNVSQSVEVTAADPVEIAGLWNLPLEDTIVLAFQNRAELQQQLAQRNISEQNRRVALADLGPQVSLSANYNIFDTLQDDFGITDGYSVGATVSLNLFEGGAARARARQQEANIAIAESTFNDQRNQIRFAVEQNYSELQSNLENIQTATLALEQARESLRLARLRFQAGVGTQTDVINQENALTTAEGNRITAILDYNRAFANLQRAVTSDLPR